MKKDKVKVLIFGMTSIVGGIETFLINLYEKIDLDNIQMDFLISGTLEGEYRRKIEARKGKIYEVEKISKNPIKSINKIKKIYNENHYDILHVNLCNAFYFIYALPILFFNKNRPIVITHSHSNSDIDKFRHYMMRPILKHYTDRYLACSKIAGDWMFGKRIGNSNDMIIVRNSINVCKYKFQEEIREKCRKELEVEKELVIGHVGRFVEEKNHEFLIDTFYMYYKRYGNCKLVLVGDGTLKNKIQNKVKTLGIENQVQFLGIRNDVSEIMQAFDIFVLPSKFEGFGIVGLEAQASGLYVITSDNVAKELDITTNVKHFSLDNIEQWCNEIEEKRNLNINRKKMNEIVSKTEYNLDNLVEFIENYYRSTVKK